MSCFNGMPLNAIDGRGMAAAFRRFEFVEAVLLYEDSEWHCSKSI
jgi:hypothetical protein